MPIQNGKYVNPGWLDNGPPAIDAAEMNAISETLENLDAGGGTGGGKRYARVVVGTSTNGWTAEDCDYLCDGVDDEVEIQAAAQQIPNDVGGELLLLDGTYNISTYVSLNHNTTLSGTGRSAVFITRTGTNGYGQANLMLSLPNKCELRDLTINGNSRIFGSGDWSNTAEIAFGAGTNVNNVDFTSAINDAARAEPFTDRSLVIDNCDFSFCENGIHIDCPGEVIASNCSFSGIGAYMIKAIGINITSSGEEPLTRPLTVKLTNCVDQNQTSDILLDGTGNSTITNCFCHSITLQMTQEESGIVKPERGRHILIGNHFNPINPEDPVIIFGAGVNNCIAIGNIISGGDTVGIIQDNGENNIIYNGASGNQVTLTTSGWSSNRQTVTAPGVTASNYVTTGPTPSTFNAAMEAGVYCSGQGNGTLTFTCTTTPSSSITYTYTAQEVL